jgi:hypothetical protein
MHRVGRILSICVIKLAVCTITNMLQECDHEPHLKNIMHQL